MVVTDKVEILWIDRSEGDSNVLTDPCSASPQSETSGTILSAKGRIKVASHQKRLAFPSTHSKKHWQNLMVVLNIANFDLRVIGIVVFIELKICLRNGKSHPN